jgi:soluble lytic murein transglycosylase
MRFFHNRRFLPLFLFFLSVALTATVCVAGHTPSTDTTTVVSGGNISASSAPLATLESNLLALKRELFMDAVAALEIGDLDTFESLKEQNTDYLLYPYLEYYGLRNRLSSATDDELMTFINTYDTTPLSYRIRTQWLYRLAEDKRWDKFLEVYKGQGGAKLRCAYLEARLATDKSRKTKKEVLRDTKELWLSGKDRPAECDGIFRQFEKSNYLTGPLIWERIEKAMEQGNLSLAEELRGKLSSKGKRQVKLWIKVHKNPRKHLRSRQLRQRDLINRKIIVHGMKRLARRDAEDAKKLWESSLRYKKGFGRQELGEMDRYIALRSAYQSHPRAYEWLNQVDDRWANDTVRYWRAMSALRDQNWKALQKSIDHLPQQEKDEPKWRYWLARAMQMQDKEQEANKLFAEIAEETNYYGFLAADRIDADYRFNLESLVRNDDEIVKIAQLLPIQRARELYLVEREDDAHREWRLATRKFNEEKLQQATLLAHDWGWHYNAIITVAQTPHRSDYDVRFPTPYRDVVLDNADANEISPSLIYGIARRESAFHSQARSRVGALGLMQLMPGTARLESRLLGRERPTYSEILDEENNILLGSSYLKRMLERFGGNNALAMAAYNAGPRRVDSWIPKSGAVASDVWVDTLPFKETREYVRAVLAYATIFDWRLNQNITRISSRMNNVISKDSLTALNSIN